MIVDLVRIYSCEVKSILQHLINYDDEKLVFLSISK